MTIWNLIKHFSPDANWGDSSKIAGTLLLAMDSIREYSNIPIIINCGYATSGHVKNSFHYKGLACDWHFQGSNKISIPQFMDEHVRIVLEALDQLQLNEFVGLGIYPFWNSPGFHFDVRSYKARWWRDHTGTYKPWKTYGDLDNQVMDAIKQMS